MFGFSNKTPVLDETSILWMFDSFAWAFKNFDANVFYKETILVTPSNQHFPGQERSPQSRANMIFEQVKTYAGLKQWPFRLITEDEYEAGEIPRVLIQGPLRGSKATLPIVVEKADNLVVTYSPEVLSDPQVLIANYAHAIAHYLGGTCQEPPPGGIENWPHVTELLAVFLGFGVMMANSAFTLKIRSCASCSGPAVERTNFLSQYDITYALAIFCALKEIENDQVLPHLKKTLRPYYKKALKDVKQRDDELAKLRRNVEPLLVSNLNHLGLDGHK